MSTEKVETIVFCERCGARCRVAKGNPEAKMLRRSKEPKGLCVNCAVHDWFRNTYPVNMILAKSGPRVLAYEHIRDQFAQIMRAGYADARPEEINWNLISENWEIPFPHKIKPNSSNPCSQQELDDIKAGKKHAFTNKAHPSVCEIKNMPICETFEELNRINPGLGDKVQNLIEDSKEKIMSKDSIKKTHEPHVLPCKLTERDIAEAADKLATAIQRVESLELEKKTKVAEFKGQIDAQKERIHNLTVEVKDGIAQRSVECELLLNYSKLTATLIRLDLSEIVEERTMTEEEKQLKFEFEKSKKKKGS